MIADLREGLAELKFILVAAHRRTLYKNEIPLNNWFNATFCY